MDINNLTSGERETLMFEVLMKLRTCIPNVTRPSGILMNQNQPMIIEEKGNLYNITANIRAVDFAGKYLFLGPFYFSAKKKGDVWDVSDPRFDSGIDGCYYDIVGYNGSHLKFYKNMVTIDEEPVMFDACDGATLKEPADGQPGIVIYHMKDGSFHPFYWDLTTQNTTFMERLLEISDLMISTANKEAQAAEAKAQAAAARAAARPNFSRPAAAVSENSPFKKQTFSSRTMDPIQDEDHDNVEKPHAYGRTLKSIRPEKVEEPEQKKPDAKPVASPFMPKPEEDTSDSPFLPDDRPKRPEAPKETKSPFVPLKNVTPEMEKPKKPEGPAIVDTYIPEWHKPYDRAEYEAQQEKEPEIKPMTAESLSHLDDWKPYKSRIVTTPEAEIEKYRKLLSIGAITEDEFEIKKRQLLGGK